VWCKFVLEKALVDQLVKMFPAVYGNEGSLLVLRNPSLIAGLNQRSSVNMT
jgi:hypothetical protein